MSQSTLDQALATIQAAWRPLDSDLIGACLRALEQLAGATVSEPWLAELHERRPASTELARHPEHGFVLLAHAEPPGLYRPPHDHGRAWVVYAVQSGAMEVRTFIRVMDASGLPRLIQRDSTVLGPGEARAYLPGDIHDTRALDEGALQFRFTERDLRAEDRGGRMARYDRPLDGWSMAL